MINYSSAFKRELFNDNRQYITQVIITTTDNTTMNIGNANLWEGGCSQEDAVSSDDDLQIGSAIINKCTIEINNIYGTYDEYDFSGASVSVYVGLNVDGLDELEKKGTYVVVDASYTDSAITLECYDYMSKLDVPFENTQISFPATLGEIVSGVCSECHVSLLNVNFPHYGYVIDEMPDLESCTYREVLAWAAQIAGCFARFNANGRLELKWYDRSTLETVMNDLDGGIFDSGDEEEYTTGDSADGGSFNPWNDGDNYDGGDFSNVNAHFISSAFSHSISVDDVVITGVRILVKIVDEENKDALATHLEGTEGYIIEISDNPFITEDNVDDIIEWLGIQLIGMTFRKANLSIPSDPSIEAGDVAIYWDRKGNYYPLIISRVNFTPGESQTIVSSAQTPARNSSQRFQVDTKNYVALKKQIQQQKTAWEEAEADLIDMIDEAGGLFETDVTNQQTGKTIHYYHNKTLLSESDTRIMISDVGITFTANGTASQPTWYGLTVDGNYIANNLYAHGINADYITSGALSVKKTIGGEQKELLKIDAATGNVVMKKSDGTKVLEFNASNGELTLSPTTFTLTAANASTIDDMITGKGYQTGTQVDNKISTSWSNKTQSDIFNKLTNNGQTQGIYISNNKVYINADYIGSGTISADRIWVTDLSAIAAKIGGWNISQTSISNGYVSLDANGVHVTGGNNNGASINANGTIRFYDLIIGDGDGVRKSTAYSASVRITPDSFYANSLGTVQTGKALMMNSSGKIGETSSSIRYKEVKKALTESDIISFYSVQPVWAKYKDGHIDKEDEWYGKYIPMIIAEDVFEACHEAAIHNVKGEIEDWNHRVIIPIHQQMLINQHEKIVELQDTVKEQNDKINELEERLARLEKLLEDKM